MEIPGAAAFGLHVIPSSQFVPKVLIYVHIKILAVPMFFQSTCAKPQCGPLVNMEKRIEIESVERNIIPHGVA